ncbi:hypothetical protein EAG_10856 [Camponotus floridanus]|uniref:Uncharacterized protein n=1 Tax=Camponotus floridanus TaxID=104421 RepID=E2A9K4_CAMFO|nr:hypothetical protein EAG_10856 [Camponotus floridanus]
MDMRGCTATPRRPSGHLQKQNGYLAFWHHREMAIEPCSSALTRFHSDLVDREQKNSLLDVIECLISLFPKERIEVLESIVSFAYLRKTTHTRKTTMCLCMRNGACLAIEVGGRVAPSGVPDFRGSHPCASPLRWVAATSAVFLYAKAWQCIAHRKRKETTDKWNEREVEAKLQSFLVLGVSGGCWAGFGRNSQRGREKVRAKR